MADAKRLQGCSRPLPRQMASKSGLATLLFLIHAAPIEGGTPPPSPSPPPPSPPPPYHRPPLSRRPLDLDHRREQATVGASSAGRCGEFTLTEAATSVKLVYRSGGISSTPRRRVRIQTNNWGDATNPRAIWIATATTGRSRPNAAPRQLLQLRHGQQPRVRGRSLPSTR